MKSMRWLVVVLLVVIFAAACDGVQTTPQVGGGEVQSGAGKPQPTTGMTVQGTKPVPAEQTPAGLAASPVPGEAAQTEPSPAALPLPGMELEMIGQKPLELSLQAGAYWIRRNALDWAKVEPQQGARDWQAVAALEEELPRVFAGGGQVVLVIRGAPEWAQALPGVWCGLIKADALPAFGQFAKDVVARYSQPPFNVRYFEIANEPDIAPELVPPTSPFGCMGNLNDPYYGGGAYAEMLKVVYPQAKAANSQAQVLVGGLLLDCDPVRPPEGKDCTPAKYLEGILKAGGGDYLDGVSFHAYDYYGGQLGSYSNANWYSAWNVNGPVVQPKARYLRSLLDQYGFQQKFLMNTEAGLVCGRDATEEPCQAPEFTLTKAYYAAEVNFAAFAEGLRSNIWYSLTGWRGTNLVDKDLKPNQAYTAYQFSAQQLNGAVFQRIISDFPGVRGYEIQRGGQAIWFLVSGDGAEHPVTLPFTPSAVYDVFGAAQAPAAQISITAAPLYIVR